MQENVVLSAYDASVGYSKRIVVDGLSFEVRTGEVLTLIGENGSGKSTVLKSIVAQLPFVNGTAYVCGRDISLLTDKDISRLVSVLFTKRMNTERMTCEEAVETGRYPYTGRLGILGAEDRKAVADAMEITGCLGIGDRDFEEISDGQRQTVMLARAIAQQPHLMVLDEPTSFLDINNKLRLIGLLRQLAREKNIGIIMSLHELDLAQRFSDRVLCICNGRAVKTGTPEEVFTGDVIKELYGLEWGSYIPEFASAEGKRNCDVPKVFVVGGGGSGLGVYRRLQREGVPFGAGVIQENDIDYPVAKATASVIVTEKAFEPISDKAMEQAKKIIEECDRLVCTINKFGTFNRENNELLKFAESKNIKVERVIG